MRNEAPSAASCFVIALGRRMRDLTESAITAMGRDPGHVDDRPTALIDQMAPSRGDGVIHDVEFGADDVGPILPDRFDPVP